MQWQYLYGLKVLRACECDGNDTWGDLTYAFQDITQHLKHKGKQCAA